MNTELIIVNALDNKQVVILDISEWYLELIQRSEYVYAYILRSVNDQNIYYYLTEDEYVKLLCKINGKMTTYIKPNFFN